LDLKQQFSDLFDRLGVESLPPRYPGVAVEIAADRINAVRLAVDRKGGKARVAAFETLPLPDGAIEVALTKPNILQPAILLEAMRSVFVKIGPRDHRVSLLLPDDVARVSLLGFAALPKTRRELGDLVRFRMAKSLPFKPEEAKMDLMLLGSGQARPGASSVSVLAAFVHRAVLEQYEALLSTCGYWPGLVSLSSFELFNLFRPLFARKKIADRDSLVLNVTRQYLSVVILRDTDIIFYRCKPHTQATNGDSQADVRREIYTSLAFYQEKLLGRGIGRVFLRCAGMPAEAIREAVGAETGCEVELLDPLTVVPSNGAPAVSEETGPLIAPVLGAVAGRMS
jgi:Tfp pilus assembly PilM family ATPase